ncbi:AAA family ATPase [Clostridium manihotivorum]|uniref:Cell division protein n=1 Tax=Clostridium manihotivorum TaxID=2320868 RepID=A0A410DWP9_9CLOT|nr:AAA family ATPase [Clostridium manihotivorum]QAA33487.1 cell division protein [Clostridium manihotivorum]
MDKIELLRGLVKENPQSSNAWYLLGSEYSEVGNYSEALKAFSEALKYCDDKTKGMVINELTKLSNAENLNKLQPEASTKVNSDETFETKPSAQNIADNIEESNETENIASEEEYNNVIPLRVIEGGKNYAVLDEKEENIKVTFNDVGGLDDLKETIKMKIIKPFVSPGLFDRFKKKVGGGILLFGPPGCGKTFMAKATAGECNANFIPVHITDILNPYLGQSALNVKDIFETARAKKPCVMFFDEIDTIGFNRSKLSSEHMRPVIDQLLTEIEGIDSSTQKLLIIGATNMPWDVDSAFKRPGRFDKTVFVPPPDQKAREAIFKLKLKDRPMEIIDYITLSKLTPLYSGADIENVVEVATENVIEEIMRTGIERPIGMNDLNTAIQMTKPSTLEWLRTIKNYIKYSNQSGLYDEVDKFINANKKLL